MKLSPAKLTSRLRSLKGWKLDGDAIVRQFTFDGFPEAIAFVTRLAFDAQAHDHHPDLTISYKRVTVSWSTHDEGGVTEKDVRGARVSTTIAQAIAPLKLKE
jgi:4a-hydroxytetrahydrobiopterin dehydratase